MGAPPEGGEDPIGAPGATVYDAPVNPLVLIFLLAFLIASSGFYFGGAVIGCGAVGIIVTACVLSYFFVDGRPARPKGLEHWEG